MFPLSLLNLCPNQTTRQKRHPIISTTQLHRFHPIIHSSTMSVSSARRINDPTGRNAPNALPMKRLQPLAPVSTRVKNSSPDACRISPALGKENHKTISRSSATTQKLVILPVPRTIKASTIAINDGEIRVRRSTSSVPRGRSSSPSELSAVDVPRNRRVSVDRIEKASVSQCDRALLSGRKSLSRVRDSSCSKQRKEITVPSELVNDGGLNGLRFLRDFNANGKLRVDKSKQFLISHEINSKAEKSEDATGSYVAGNSKGEINISSNTIKCTEAGFDGPKDSARILHATLQNVIQGIDEFKEDSSLANGERPMLEMDLCLNEFEKKSVKHVSVFEVTEEKSSSAGGISNWACNKYPSNLHEKLAFLEGKVKRIASDINRTKEMLETNNSDASKLILSDIQNKISGIEKAMDHVASDSDTKLELLKGNERARKMIGQGHIKEKDDFSALEKGLDTDELENRLVPHHRLLRNRVAVNPRSSRHPELDFLEPSCKNAADTIASSPIDENRIALTFLASLSKNQTKEAIRNKSIVLESYEVQEMDDFIPPGEQVSSQMISGKHQAGLILTTDETLDEFDEQKNKKETTFGEEAKDTSHSQLKEIGFTSSTCGWFVSDGEAVLLAHSDGSCSFYDVTNCEEKAEYNPPEGVPPSIWRDCWIIRAPGADGCARKYVVAASAGNLDSGFCSWDFYSKEVRAFVREGGESTSRAVLAPLHNNTVYKRYASYDFLVSETQQWWYRPCGPLIVCTANSQKAVKVFDIRDGEEIMRWEIQKPVSAMEYSSPLQWRNRGQVVIAETETVSLWDVSSLNPHASQMFSLTGREISALHINNTDAELGGGVRQRVSSSEAEGNDGVFCTQDSINILDFRHPTGVAFKIPKLGVDAQSLFSRGDSIFLGCSDGRPGGKKQPSSLIQQFSLRKQRLFSSYALPEHKAHSRHKAISQVWGNSNLVMGVSGLGLFVFDTQKDDCQSRAIDYGNTQKVKEIVGPDDLYSPSFDYTANRALLISRDRPALWRHLP